MAVVSMVMVSCGGGKKDTRESPKTVESVEVPVAKPVVEEAPVAEEPAVHHFVGKVAGADVHMSMLVDGTTVVGRYYYDSQRKKGSKASMMFFGEKDDDGLELTEFFTDHPTGQFDGEWNNGVYEGRFTRAKDGKEFDFSLTEAEESEDFFVLKDLAFEIPDFEEDHSSFDSFDDDDDDLGSADWDKILDEYEQYVNKYYSFAEKVSKGNASAMADALSMSEKAASLAEKLERADDNLSTAQANRLLKIQNKMAQAAAKMAGAGSKVEDMMNDLEDMDLDDAINSLMNFGDDD